MILKKNTRSFRKNSQYIAKGIQMLINLDSAFSFYRSNLTEQKYTLVFTEVTPIKGNFVIKLSVNKLGSSTLKL